MYRHFKDMPVWQKAMETAEVIHKLTVELPRTEDYGFTAQIRRSALSISANIAEALEKQLDALYNDINKIILSLKTSRS